MAILEGLLASVETQNKRLEQLTAELAELRRLVAPAREVYSLADLAELPESPSLKTLRNCPEKQPRGGLPDGYRGAAKCWYASTVLSWRRELSPGPAGEPLKSRLRAVR